MKYYRHSTSAFEDEKIAELFQQFGYEGLGLFYTALEKFAKQEKPIKTSVLKAQLKVGKRLEKCWKFMESLGIIYSNNGQTFNEKILNDTEKYQEKCEKNAKRISDWRENQGVIKNVTGYTISCNTDVTPVKKRKEKKVKENIIYIYTEFSNLKITEGANKEFVDQYGIDMTNLFYKKLSNYKLSSGKIYKDDAAAIRTWVIDEVLKNQKSHLKIVSNGTNNKFVAASTSAGKDIVFDRP